MILIIAGAAVILLMIVALLFAGTYFMDPQRNFRDALILALCGGFWICFFLGALGLGSWLISLGVSR